MSKTRWALSRKCPPGISGGTRSVSTDRSWEPTRKDQYSGSAEPRQKAARAAYTNKAGRRFIGPTSPSRRPQARLTRAIAMISEEEQPGDGGGHAEVADPPAELPEVHREGLVLPVGAAGALGVEESWLGEDLQSADGRGDDHEDHRRPDQRDGQRGEAAYRPGAVERGGLVDVARHRLHRRQQDQGVVAGPAPVDHRRDGEVRGQRVDVPGDRPQADPAERRVDQPVAVAEDVAEDQRDGGRGDDERQQHRHPPQGAGPQVGVEQPGEHIAIRTCGIEESRKIEMVLRRAFQK